MGGWTNNLISVLLHAVLNGLTSATQGCLNWALGLMATTMFASPDVTGLPQVRYACSQAQFVANACMTLIVMIAGILAMSHGSVQDRYSLKELLPRMLIAFTVANLSIPIIQAAVAGANALTAALIAGPFASADSFTQIRRVLLDTTTNQATILLAAVLQQLAMWMLILVIITWLGRLTVLLVLAGTGPVALMCHALPQTDLVARLWWRSLGGVLAVQVLQAVTLHLAVATLLTGNASLASLGLFTDATGILNMIIACYLLWLVIRIPKWVARTIGGTSGRGSNILGYVMRVVVVQRLLGAVGLGRGRLFGRGRPGPSGGPRSPAAPLHGRHQPVHLHPAHTGHPAPGRPPAAPAAPPPRPAAPPGAGPGAAGATAPPARPPGTQPGPSGPGRHGGAPSTGTGWPVPPAGPRTGAGRRTGTGWPGTGSRPASPGVRRDR